MDARLRRSVVVPSRALRAGFALVLLALLCATPSLAQKRGGSLVVALEADVPGFDPLTVGIYGPPTVDVATALFETLTGLDEAGKAVPRLALSWTPSDDYRTWTFRLRPGVKFHDGTPFDANAVKANLDRQKDPANKCRCAAYITHIRAVEVVDPLTAVVRLNNPMVLFPEGLARVSQNSAVHSPAAWAAGGAGYNRKPVFTQLINQQPVRLDVAFHMPSPTARQFVRPAPGR